MNNIDGGGSGMQPIFSLIVEYFPLRVYLLLPKTAFHRRDDKEESKSDKLLPEQRFIAKEPHFLHTAACAQRVRVALPLSGGSGTWVDSVYYYY